MVSYIKYYFENFISRKSNFIYFLILMGAVFAVIILLIEMSFGLLEEGSLFNLWWNRLLQLLEIKNSEASSGKQIVNLLYWVFSIAFSGTIIAFLAAKISNFINDLKKGLSRVIDTNHYVIVGWNSSIFKVFQEIKIANENQSKPTILCFNGMDNIEMNAKINLEFPNQKGLRIITRSGNIYSAQDLARTNMVKSKSVIILDDSIIPKFNIETTILASKINLEQQNIPLIVQMKEDYNIPVLTEIMANQVYPIHKNKIISNVTSQSIRNKHISAVVMDFLDFDGDEIYFLPVNKLIGKSFKQAMLLLSEVTLIGIKEKNGKVTLNPDKEYIILKDDLLVVIAEDDDVDIALNEYLIVDKKLNELKISLDTELEKDRLSICILGWSKLGQQIIERTIPFLSEDSEIHFAYNEELVHKAPKLSNQYKINHNITILNHEQNKDIEKILINNIFDVILIVGYDDVTSEEVSDTNSLLLNFYVRSILDRQKNNKPTRIIIQLNDGTKEELIPKNKYNELIVSDTLSALMISQLADNPKLWTVFEELFSFKGLKINMSTIFKYLDTKDIKSIKVIDLILLALEKNQIFIGYILQDKLHLNPPKSKEIIIDLSLEIVYIS